MNDSGLPSDPGERRLMDLLGRHGIPTTTYRHEPVFTVADNQRHRGQLPGGHCKCLFLKDKRGGLWLVVALEHQRVDLKVLAATLGVGRFSFGSAELLRETLGVEPGAVTPFAVINDTGARVTVVLDRAMLGHDPLTYPPLHNAATMAIRAADLERFLAALGRTPRVLDLPVLAPDAGRKPGTQ
jgi:Ala-tRNA(Pro) deacylase